MNNRGLTRQTKLSPRKFGPVGKRAKQAANSRRQEILELEEQARKLDGRAWTVMGFGLLALAACFGFYFANMDTAFSVSLLLSLLAMPPYFKLRRSVDSLLARAAE